MERMSSTVRDFAAVTTFFVDADVCASEWEGSAMAAVNTTNK
jgi:hypothetical protein